MELAVLEVEVFLLCSDDVGFDLGFDSMVPLWVESFDVNGGAEVLLERRGSGSRRLPWSGPAGGYWSLAAIARPVPHRAGSIAAFARPEPLAHRKSFQAGPVSATWAGAGYR